MTKVPFDDYFATLELVAHFLGIAEHHNINAAPISATSGGSGLRVIGSAVPNGFDNHKFYRSAVRSIGTQTA